jgi:hypothetical protein
MKTLAAAALLAGAAGFGGAWQLQSLRWEAADGRRAAADAESQRLAQRSADGAATRFEADRARIAAQRRVITREVERVITIEAAAAAAVCIGPDGLRILAEAVAGRDPGQPAPGLPSSAAAR